jgi:hypothetical protein
MGKFGGWMKSGRKAWRRPMAGLAAAGLIVGGLQGCAALKDLSVDEAVASNATTDASWPGMQLTFSLGASTQQIIDATYGSMSRREARILASSTLVVDVHSGDGASLDHAVASRESTSIALDIDGNTAVEEKSIHGTLYLRLNLRDFHEDFGVPRRDLRRFIRTSDRINKQIPGIRALAHDDWVKVPASQLKATQKDLGGRGLSAGLEGRMRRALMKAFGQSASISDAGSTAQGHEYVVGIAIRPFLRSFLYGPAMVAATKGTDLQSAFHHIVGSVPNGTKADVDLFASGGALREISFNLDQWRTDGPAVPLDIALAPTAQLTAPKHATPLNLQKLLEGVVGTSSSSGGGVTITSGAGGSRASLSRLRSSGLFSALLDRRN